MGDASEGFGYESTVKNRLVVSLLWFGTACSVSPPSVDAGRPDSGAVDSGAVDAGAVDSGGRLSDSGPADAGAFDGGVDAAVADAGAPDAARVDAGAGDVFPLLADTDRTFIGNTLRGSTWDRPDSPDDTCPASSQPGIGAGARYDAYRFRNEDSVQLIVAFDLETSYDPHLTAYSGVSLPSDLLQCLAIDDNISATNLNASLLFTMMPGETVIVVLSGHAASDAGPYTLRAQAVPL